MTTASLTPYYLLLCGGKGDRFRSVTSVPKPSMCIRGRPMYVWVIESLLRGHPAGTSLDIAVAAPDTSLGVDLFCSIRKAFALLPTVRFHHAIIPYSTRGPVETALTALTALTTLTAVTAHISDRTLNTISVDRPVWILDNDVVFDVDTPWNTALGTAAVAVLAGVLEPATLPATTTSPYSHIICVATGLHDDITRIVEKTHVSDTVVMGGYGFGGGAAAFRALVDEFVASRMTSASGGQGLASREWFMSDVVQVAIAVAARNGMSPPRAIKTPAAFTIGTPEQVRDALKGRLSSTRLPQLPQKTWVFDLDQTLVTLPRVPGDYSTCLPLSHTVALVRRLHRQGDRIVIHTARGMQSHRGDVEKIKMALGDVTRSSLARLDIPYHDLVFGKPLGDVYVDDRSVNPTWCASGTTAAARFWTTAALGFGIDDEFDAAQMEDEERTRPIAANVCRLQAVDGVAACRKTARTWSQLAGYRAFLDRVHRDPACVSIRHAVPRLLEACPDDAVPSIVVEWITGTSAARMNAWGMLTPDVVVGVLDLVAAFHAVPFATHDDRKAINRSLIMSSYMPKLDARMRAHPEAYSAMFDGDDSAVQKVLERFSGFFRHYRPRLAAVIHGDLWLHNVVWDTTHSTASLIDMRGRLGGDTITTAGDMAYDYAKLLQSLAGFDALLFRPAGCGVATGVARAVETAQHDPCTNVGRLRAHAELAGIDFRDVRTITAFLILGSLPFHPELSHILAETRVVIEALLL